MTLKNAYKLINELYSNCSYTKVEYYSRDWASHHYLYISKNGLRKVVFDPITKTLAIK